MDMKLLALTAGEEHAHLLVRISGTLSGFSDTDTAFATYPTLKALLPAFAEALKAQGLIVLAVDGAKYNAIRTKLCAALSLATVEDRALYERLSENTALPPEEIEQIARVPKNAALFPNSDGLYTGLAVEKGKQIIVFLPLEEESLTHVLKNGLVPYLMRKSVKAESAAPKKHETPALEVSAAAGEVVRRTVNLLRENNATVAVSSTPSAQIIRSLGVNMPDFETFFLFTPHVEDKGDYSMTDYAALLAKSAKELSGATFGACISDVCDAEGGTYVCVTVADDKTAVVRKLYKEDDETENSFLHDAAEELVELIGEKAAGKGMVGIEVADAGNEKSRGGFLSRPAGKVTMSVIALVLAAAVTVGCIFFVRKRRAREAQNTTQPPVVTEQPDTTIAPVVTDTVTISEFIYNEMQNGVQETPAETTTANSDGVAIDTTGGSTATGDEIPSEMIVNGRTLDAKEAVARMIEAEMDSTYNTEALKAQTVAIYTYLKYRNTNWKITGVTLADDYSDEVYNAVRAVFGEYLSFNGAPAFTPFFRLSAGRTAACETVFGTSYAYLRAADSISDRTEDGYLTQLIIPADEIRELVEAYDASITLGEETADWLEVTEHDGAVDTGTGYVHAIRVGDREISGREFVDVVMAGKNLPSVCFSVMYQSETNEFLFEVYGIGYGVGMSQRGADRMAATGAEYTEILSRYYSGTQLTA